MAYRHLLLVYKQNRRFWNTKSKSFFRIASHFSSHLREGLGGRLRLTSEVASGQRGCGGGSGGHRCDGCQSAKNSNFWSDDKSLDRMCQVYGCFFEYQIQLLFNKRTEDLVVKLIAFGFQIKISVLEQQKQNLIFQNIFFQGCSRCHA